MTAMIDTLRTDICVISLRGPESLHELGALSQNPPTVAGFPAFGAGVGSRWRVSARRVIIGSKNLYVNGTLPFPPTDFLSLSDRIDSHSGVTLRQFRARNHNRSIDFL
ncbi:hypothetical protein ZHAS_00014003 [Anopheles sinensis]|uniref:Uncharacterized protein n=1 Tax=Anopheles sinensis TaxID=74873 RepID=A0A084W738_ANOSI|nr:hypothetical protein ZHAS_00014003 [Anopheles sinensis]